METKSSWLVLLLGLILTVGSSEATMGCPENVKKTSYPVIQMCKRQNTSNSPALYLDAFVSETTSITCDCHLHATQPITIGVSPVLFPERDCELTLTIHTPRILRYTCAHDNQSEAYGTNYMNITNETNLIQIQTRNATKTATYCLFIYTKGGGAPLSLECFPPANGSVSSSTQTKDKTETTLLISTTTHSPSTAPTTSGKISFTVSPSSSEVDKSETTEQTDSEVRTDRQSDAEPFPVVAVVGGAVALIAVVVVVLVVAFLVRRKRNKKRGPGSDEDEDYCNLDADPYKDQKTISSGNQLSDDYASIEDKRGDTPGVALNASIPTMSHDDTQREQNQNDVSNMYAKVNKKKRPMKSKPEADAPDLYTSVDKTKKVKQTLAVGPAGDVYAVVNKQKKANGKGSSEPKTKGFGSNGKSSEPESKISSLDESGVVYTEVRKPKKSGNSPTTQSDTPGVVYTELEFENKSPDTL